MTCPRCTEWHRRAQAAEAAVATTIEQCRREGVSLGRTLANAGYRQLEERIAELEAALSAKQTVPECPDGWHVADTLQPHRRCVKCGHEWDYPAPQES